jgi:uncharacterized membrane protein AbrB (regulator of aidB expression)
MAGVATVVGILLVLVAIPFGLMIGPLGLGVVIAYLGWRHVSAALEIPAPGAVNGVAA